MGNLNVLMEWLEDRRLLTIAPTIVATMPGGITNLAVRAQAIFFTTPETRTSAGGLYGTSVGQAQPGLIGTFGPNSSSNTLGIDPNEIVIDSGGFLYGDSEFGGADANPHSPNTSGGTLWYAPGSAPMLITPLNYQNIHGLGRSGNGALFAIGTIPANQSTPAITTAFAWTPGVGVTNLSTSNAAATPLAIFPDNAGHVFVFYNSSTGPYVDEFAEGNYQSSTASFAPFGALGNVQLAGVVIDGLGNFFATVDGATNAVVELGVGSQQATVLVRWSSTTMPQLENPVLGPYDEVFATAFDASSPSSAAALLMLLPGQTSFITVTSLSSSTALTALTGYYQEDNGDLFGVMGDSIVDFPGDQLKILSAGAEVRGTLPNNFGPELVSDGQNIFGTLPSTNTSGGSIFEIPGGSTTPQILATFGPSDSTNTLGINPRDILIDANGNLFGDCEYGGSQTDTHQGYAQPYNTGGTLWELPKGSSNIIVLTSLSFTNVSDLMMNPQGTLFFLGGNFPHGGDGSEAEYAWTAAGGMQAFGIGEGGSDPRTPGPDGFTIDAAGNFYELASTFPGDGQFAELDMYTPGNYNSAASTLDISMTLGILYYQSIFAGRDGALFISVHFPSETFEKQGSSFTPIGLPTVATADSKGDLFGYDTTGTLVELPAGGSQLKTIASVTSTSEITELTTDSSGDLYGVIGSTLVEFPAGSSPVIPPSQGLAPTITQSKTPASLVANVRFGGWTRVQLAPISSAAPAGRVTTVLFAVSSTSTIKLGAMVQRYRPGHALHPGVIRFAARLPAGSYTLVAQSVDSAGEVINSAAGPTLTVAEAFTNVAATVIAVTPRIHAGKAGIFTLVLNNTGNIRATGPLAITITANNSVIFSTTVRVKNLRTHRAIRLRIKIPATQTAGSYIAAATSTWQGSIMNQSGGVLFQVI